MITVNEALGKLHNATGKKGRLAFFSAFAAAVLTHMVALTSDFPNHDGLSSMYFDQNMITSGRWFLGAACAPSSFYMLPWLAGLLAIIYISVAAVFLVKILNVENPVFIVMISALIAVFPSLASNFAYVFTMDGYMLGMLLCVMSVRAASLDKKFGWIAGAVMLAFGMGCYQSYICIAMVLCLYKAGEILMGEKDGYKSILKYAGMGVLGVVLYYVLLKVLLLIQGKELDTYQGINGMSSGNGTGLVSTIKLMYTDFFKFSLSKAVVPNILTGIVLLAIVCVACICFIRKAVQKGLLKKPLFYVFAVLFIVILPCVMNAILVISASVTYHVLMRYQWAFLIAVLIAVIDHAGEEKALLVWISAVACCVTVLSYAVTDNIAYSNLNKKYEKTYAYCLRLADRIEQTEGYYRGIPIALVGVVGLDQFPTTDITGDVTGNLLGVSGDYLLYKPENYRDFFKYYLGISFNILGEDEVANFYNEDFYAVMESFPGETSVLLHDGVIYVKTENVR